MISKVIKHKPQNDSYKNLARYIANSKVAVHELETYHDTVNYIADVNNKGEKILYKWHGGCESEDYDLSIKEVFATQKMNQRVKTEKTYHLVISFRPEDESKLTEEVLQDIEQEFTQALGFTFHQRHCGVHKNTENLHMHIAYNMINPYTFAKHSPFRDYKIQEKLRKELEEKYGLASEPSQTQEQEKIPDKAKSLESHTGEESFHTYVLDFKEQILSTSFSSWEELHVALAKIGVECCLRGNGLILKDMHSDYTMKASSFDRAFSKKHLEGKLGSFLGSELSKEEKTSLQQYRYSKAPIQILQGENRKALHQEYQEGIEQRKAFLAKSHEELKTKKETLDEQILKQNDIILKSSLSQKEKNKLLFKLSQKEKAENKALQTIKTQAKEEITKIVPYCNWVEFLKQKVEEGNELALAVLRSRKEEVQEEKPAKPQLRTQINTVYNNDSLTKHDKKAISSILRMQAIIKKENLQGITWKIDAKGTVFFFLPTGGVIKDTAQGITFSNFDKNAVKLAKMLSEVKYRQRANLEENVYAPRTRKGLSR